jgi:hypothetical protein
MKSLYLLITIFIAGLIISSKPLPEFPNVEITNGLIKARLYLPDIENGYYRGTRFDWSGVISNLEYDGHTYFGQWFKNHDPKINDAIVGPVNDFLPLNYNEAKPGENFVKIGVGVLTKANDSPYSIMEPYEIVDHGKWDVKVKSDQVDFVHKLDSKNYSYEYKKSVKLTKGKSQMVLEHFLTNTGNNTIETSVYNHNFFILDERPVGPEYVIRFPFNINGKLRGKENLADIHGDKIVYPKNLKKGEQAYFPILEGFGNTPKDHRIWIENKSSGAGVEILGDRPISKLVFWSTFKTVCPEPYIDIIVEPGDTFQWSTSYNFYSIE